jgi:hypothetical protein
MPWPMVICDIGDRNHGPIVRVGLSNPISNLKMCSRAANGWPFFGKSLKTAVAKNTELLIDY